VYDDFIPSKILCTLVEGVLEDGYIFSFTVKDHGEREDGLVVDALGLFGRRSNTAWGETPLLHILFFVLEL